MRWTGDGAGTWYTHAAVAVVVPPVATWPVGFDVGAMATVSVALLVLFMVRERVQRARKRREGTWTDQWRRDRAGDLLGPVTATVGYVVGWLVG